MSQSMLHAAVQFNGEDVTSPRVWSKAPMKTHLWMDYTTDPGFARSHLDPPEGTLSDVQSQRQDV